MIKKCVSVFWAAAAMVFALTGCQTSTSKSYTFSVETGDSIKVSLNTADGYDITSELPFVVSCDGNTLSQGTFIVADGFELYKEMINGDESAVILDSGTGILLGNNVSEESAKECFERLTFSVE